MVKIERSKPVHHIIKERELLHLSEPTEIDIRTLPLHIHHLTYLLLQLFHPLLVSILMKNTLQGVFFLLHNAESSYSQVRIAHDIRHDITLNLVIILLSIATIEELYL